MANKDQHKDEIISNKDENLELNPEMLEKVAGGKHFTTDPIDPDFDTFMLGGKAYWERHINQ